MFTNVAFLQKIALQTRKSSQLKKWLILTTRMLLFSALIFAFSQPYFSDQKSTKKVQNNIYIDNSLSTNTKGKKGDLLQVAAQEIINNISEKETYSLLTNDNFYKNISALELKKVALSIKNTTKSIAIEDVFLKFESLKKTKTNTLYKNILISDFQNIKNTVNNKFTNVTQPYSLIKLQPTIKNNLSVDSVYISEKTTTGFTINTLVKNQGTTKTAVPISLFNDEKLIGKRSFSIDKNATKNIEFKIENKDLFLGKIQLNFNDTYAFDNRYFFVQNSLEKTPVLALGKSNDFLAKIFTKQEYLFTESSLKNITYNALPKQQLIILNELNKISTTLASSLEIFVKNGGHLIIIPNENIDLNSYNRFLKALQMGKITQKNTNSLKITEINYKHPIFKNVFSKKVQNFQYPTTKTNYSSTPKGNAILNFENKKAFVSSFGHIYWFSSPLNKNSSNFTNSPLIVPLLYNIGQKSFQNSQLQYAINQKNTIDIAIKLAKNDILSIANTTQSFIPLQQAYQNKTAITIEDQIEKAGFYTVFNKKNHLKTIAFNNSKKESLLNFTDIQTIAAQQENIKIAASIESFFKEQNKKNKVHWLWKWFLVIAIVSLFFEILILKFLKE